MTPLKSQESHFLQVCATLFVEVARAYPSDLVDVEYDFAHLVTVVRSRGVSVLTTDLPKACKHFDRCLSEGTYVSGGESLTASASGEVHLPKFMGYLYRRIFHESGCLQENPDVCAISLVRQILLAFKKVDLPCSEQNIQREIAEFLSVDASLPAPHPCWAKAVASERELDEITKAFSQSDEIAERAVDLYADCVDEIKDLLEVLDIVSGIMATTLGPYNPEEWNCKHGPGAISVWPVDRFKYRFENWSERLDSAYPYDLYAFHGYGSWARSAARAHLGVIPFDFGEQATDCEVSSKLIAVPKDLTKPRLIASEPCENMWCQQNLRAYMYERVRTTSEGKHCWLSDFLKFDDQVLNQRLAIEGSLSGTLATVDLSAASDRVTCSVVGHFWRRNPTVLAALRATRTLSTLVNHDRVELRKFATMGNACTFPVQSLLFLSIAISSVLYARKKKPSIGTMKELIGSVAVFGDDIIVPVDCRIHFERLLNLLWFKVNPGKTFWSGKFRESCGVDAFAGVTVTPAYYASHRRENPEDIASAVEVSNNFYLKGLLVTAEFLAQTVMVGIPTVSMSSGVLGFKSRSGLDNSHNSVRWNQHLQRDEILIPVLSQKGRVSRVLHEGQLLQYFTDAPSPDIVWRAGVAGRPKLKMLWDWVALSDLQGP